MSALDDPGAEPHKDALPEKGSDVFAGPLPPPEVLAEYESIAPGLADQLVSWTREESSHRRQLEYARAESTATLARRGQLLAYSLLTALTAAATIAGLAGSGVTALAALIPVVVSLVGTVLGFYFGSQRESDLREARRLSPELANLGRQLATDRELLRAIRSGRSETVPGP